jgi:hypothetical protein
MANLRMSIGRRHHSLFLPILEDGTDCLLDVGESFLLGIALSHAKRFVTTAIAHEGAIADER